jgi:diadenosine tetraphosphate (Ap4A) HIT family hydrolase
MTDYSKFLIRQYKLWGVYVHENQGYLGRCVIWCDRKDAFDLTDATHEEREELFVILKELKQASEKAFGGEWFNYAFLGNETRHLHGHFVPRYSTEKEFAGIKFKDERWGHNYRTDHSFETSVVELFHDYRIYFSSLFVKAGIVPSRTSTIFLFIGIFSILPLS